MNCEFLKPDTFLRKHFMACLTIYKAKEPIQEANANVLPNEQDIFELRDSYSRIFFFSFGGGWRSAAETEDGLDCYLKVVVNTQYCIEVVFPKLTPKGN